MNQEVALYFRDQLREARSVALKDAEAFEQLVFVVERIGVWPCEASPHTVGRAVVVAGA